MMMTPSQIRRELRRLVAGERTEAAVQEAARLVAEYKQLAGEGRAPVDDAERQMERVRQQMERVRDVGDMGAYRKLKASLVEMQHWQRVQSLKAARAAQRAEDAAAWRKVIGMRRGGMGSAVVWRPGGRENEPASVRENEQATYLRHRGPWR